MKVEDIKFRGLRSDGKGWVYGGHVTDPKGRHRIYWQPFPEASSNTYHFVDPKTVGQFIGRYNLYAGDIMEITAEVNISEGFLDDPDFISQTITAEVAWDEEMFGFDLKAIKKAPKLTGWCLHALDDCEWNLIGNVHEQGAGNES